MAVGDVIPPEYLSTRIATGQLTADSATWAGTESGALISATGFLTAGQTYIIQAFGRVSSDVTGTEISLMRIRADGPPAGAHLLAGAVFIPNNVALGISMGGMYTEYTAGASGSKTFTLSGLRNTGTGNHRIRASTDTPAYLIVDLKVPA
jgi:hypothetical protein